jgi:hypothetical protein
MSGMYERVSASPTRRHATRDRDVGFFLTWLALQRLRTRIYYGAGPRKQAVKVHRSRARVNPFGAQKKIPRLRFPPAIVNSLRPPVLVPDDHELRK